MVVAWKVHMSRTGSVGYSILSLSLYFFLILYVSFFLTFFVCCSFSTKKDHMLSYFLGGNVAGGSSGTNTGVDSALAMPTDFASTTHLQQLTSSIDDLHMLSEQLTDHRDSEMEPNDHDVHMRSSGNGILKEGRKKDEEVDIDDGEEEEEEDQEDGFHVPPPTPMVPQFFSKSKGSGRPPVDGKKIQKEPSWTTLTQTLISGGPVVQQNLTQKIPSNMSLNSLGSTSGGHYQSPLSPALMIGGQTPENLLLPPEGMQHRTWAEALHAQQQAHVRQGQHPSLAPYHSMPMPPPNQSTTAHSQAGPPQPFSVPSHSTSPRLWVGNTPQGSLSHLNTTDTIPAAAGTASNTASTAVESEEKRAKRLERNRESARKSRRKKKERLESLEAQVQQLQYEIATERLLHMAGMVAGLQAKRRAVREQFEIMESPRIAIRESGPESSIFQTVVDFTYGAMKQDLLPPYQKFWLWFTRQPEGFYLAGKQKYVNERDNVSMGRISSKQVGEEWSKESKGPPLGRIMEEDGNVVQPNHTSYVNDAVRFWPLVCYEHQFSVDQEEKFLALRKRISTNDDDRTWIQAVESVQAVKSLSQAMTSVCGMASQREERTWVGILEPHQASRFQQWLTRERLDSLRPPSSQPTEDSSLSDICRRLQQVAISKATDR
jgi:hypothetical protein